MASRHLAAALLAATALLPLLATSAPCRPWPRPQHRRLRGPGGLHLLRPDSPHGPHGGGVRRLGPPRVGKDISKIKDPTKLRELAEKIDDGTISEDVLDDDDAKEAFRMGAKALDLTSPVQKQYADRVRSKIRESRQKREEQEKLSQPGWESFEQGKLLFENGRYESALEVLSKALEVQEPLTKLGGEIQLHLAFTLDAMGRTQDAVKILKIIEDSHPSKRIVNLAEECRFVMQAPVLKHEERDVNWGFESNADRYRPREKRTRKPTKAQYRQTNKVTASTVESKEVELNIPEWLKNPFVIAILTATVTVGAWQSAVITASQRATMQ